MMSKNLDKPINVYHLLIPPDFKEADANNFIFRLTPEEQFTFFRKKKELNRLQFLFGRLLLRSMLLNKEDKIELTNYGKPFINGQHQTEISITHSNRLVVSVLSRSGQVGIDTEFVRHTDLNSFCAFFNEYEWHSIHSALDPVRTFFCLWTRKEAIAKADGRGLDLEFQDINCLEAPIILGSQVYSCIPLWLNNMYETSIAYCHQNKAPNLIIQPVSVEDLFRTEY